MIKSGTYQIILGNGYVYFGSSNNMDTRKARHLRDLRNSCHPNSKMQRCFNKYGVFEFVVLERCLESERIAKEQLLLDANKGKKKTVNTAIIAGTGGMAGRHHTKESVERLSNALKTSPAAIAHRNKFMHRPKSAKCIEALSVAHKTSPRAIAAREKVIARHRSAQGRAKISDSMKTHFILNPRTDEAKRNMGIANTNSPAARAHLEVLWRTPKSAITKKRMSDSQKARLALKRAAA